MSEQKFVIAICSHHNEAEKAIKRLEGAGFNMKKLSIVGRDYHSEGDVVGYYSGGNRMKFWAETMPLGVGFIGGFSVLGAGLYSLGIPRNRVLQYETAIKADQFLLIGQGTEDEVDQARGVLQTTNMVEYAVHAA